MDFSEEARAQANQARWRREKVGFCAEAIEHWLRHGKAAMLLDGLDEVPADGQETAFQRISTAAALGPRCLMLANSRYGGFVEALASRLGGAVRQMDLMPIEWSELMPFLNHTLPAEQAQKLASDLQRHPQMRGVSGNPFFLNLAAFVFARNNFELPDSSVEVYEFAIAELLRVPLERGGPLHAARHSARLDNAA
jgi:predicted NACHT family NTPase